MLARNFKNNIIQTKKKNVLAELCPRTSTFQCLTYKNNL